MNPKRKGGKASRADGCLAAWPMSLLLRGPANTPTHNTGKKECHPRMARTAQGLHAVSAQN